MTFMKLVLSVLAVSFLIASPADANPPKAKAKGAYRPMIFPEAPKPTAEDQMCRGTVRATVGPTQYDLPRHFAMVYRVGDTIITSADKNHPSHDCSIKDMGNLIGFATGFYAKDSINIEVSLADSYEPHGFEPDTTFSRYKKSIDSAKADNAFVMFPGGMQKFGWNLTVAYILPGKYTQTTNKQPVLIRCILNEKGSRSGVCNTAYFMDDLFVTYSFIKQYYDEDTFPQLDQKVRATIEGMKVKTP